MSPPIQPREGCAGAGVGDVSWREGLLGFVGDTGDDGAGRAGMDDEREPRLPPLPARANASPA
jgi:hypothetical protein